MATKTLTKRNLYDADVYQEVMERIGRLEPTSTPNWGTMTVAQMLSHCAEVQATYNGKDNLTIPWYFYPLRPLVRRTIFGMQPYPKSGPTLGAYRQTTDKDFESEKAYLLETLNTFVTMDKTKAAELPHPFFGKLSLEDKGWAMYKHLSHHLDQFGV